MATRRRRSHSAGRSQPRRSRFLVSRFFPSSPAVLGIVLLLPETVSYAPPPPPKKGRAMDTTLRSLPRATQTFPHIIITRNTFLGKYSLPHPLPRPFPSPLPSPCHSLPVLPLPSSTPSLVSPSQISPPSPALKLLLHILPHILPSNSSNTLTLTLTPALKPVHYTLPHTAPPPFEREVHGNEDPSLTFRPKRGRGWFLPGRVLWCQGSLLGASPCVLGGVLSKQAAMPSSSSVS